MCLKVGSPSINFERKACKQVALLPTPAGGQYVPWSQEGEQKHLSRQQQICVVPHRYIPRRQPESAPIFPQLGRHTKMAEKGKSKRPQPVTMNETKLLKDEFSETESNFPGLQQGKIFIFKALAFNIFYLRLLQDQYVVFMLRNSYINQCEHRVKWHHLNRFTLLIVCLKFIWAVSIMLSLTQVLCDVFWIGL